MQFLVAALRGVVLTVLSVGLICVGAWQLIAALGAPEAPPTERMVRQRAIPVATRRVSVGEHVPLIESFGHVQSRRSIALATPVGGRIVAVGDGARTGARLEADDLILRLDDAAYRSAVLRARTALAEAEAFTAEARQVVNAAHADVDMARAELALRTAELTRRRELANRGVSAAADVETAELSRIAAERLVAGRLQALRRAELAVPRAELGIERARIDLAEAERRLQHTEIRAPFAGTLASFERTPGELVSPNAVLGRLLDPNDLEVVFHVTTEEYARLQRSDNTVKKQTVRVHVNAAMRHEDGQTPVVSATLERAAAVTPGSGTGRSLVAHIDAAQGQIIPGDFVAVTITEPALLAVAKIPASAATEEGGILVVDEANQLQEHMVRILRRVGDDLIVKNAPPGARYVVTRRPGLGPGLPVVPYDLGDVDAQAHSDGNLSRPQHGSRG